MSLVISTTSSEHIVEPGLRREFLTLYPNGHAPLLTLLTLLGADPTDTALFAWTEQRQTYLTTTGVSSGGGQGPFLSNAGVFANPLVVAANTEFRMHVLEPSRFKVGDTIVISGVTLTGPLTGQMLSCDVVSAPGGYLGLKHSAALSIVNSSADVGQAVTPVGSVKHEGSLLSNGNPAIRHPIEVSNYTQIMRDPITFTGNVVLQPEKLDEAGPYMKVARQAWFDHSTAIENMLIFGQRETKIEVVDGENRQKRYCGGLIWYLREWHKVNGGMFNYRPGGAAINESGFTDDNRRIFQVNGNCTVANWKTILRRVFQYTTNAAGHRVFLCGTGAAEAIQTYYEDKITINRDVQREHKLGFGVMEVTTAHGTFSLVVDPKMSAHPYLKDSFFALALENLKLRPFVQRDTHIKENIHPNNFDGKQDEIFSELGFEVQYPETHTWVQGITSISG